MWQLFKILRRILKLSLPITNYFRFARNFPRFPPQFFSLFDAETILNITRNVIQTTEMKQDNNVLLKSPPRQIFTKVTLLLNYENGGGRGRSGDSPGLKNTFTIKSHSATCTISRVISRTPTDVHRFRRYIRNCPVREVRPARKRAQRARAGPKCLISDKHSTNTHLQTSRRLLSLSRASSIRIRNESFAIFLRTSLRNKLFLHPRVAAIHHVPAVCNYVENVVERKKSRGK